MGFSDHKFFCQDSEGFQIAKSMSTKVKTYDLSIRPNAKVRGIPVEADETGQVVAVRYANGQQLRKHTNYVIFCGPLENSFFDRNLFAHPLD